MKYFLYCQNNSDARYIESGNIRVNVIIRARNEASADQRARHLGLFNLPYCECCGPRFRPGDCFAYDTVKEAIQQARPNHYNHRPSYIVHY